MTSENSTLSPELSDELRCQALPSPTLVPPPLDLSLHLLLYLMPTTTRDAAKKKNANKPVQPILKIKLTPGQVRSAIRLSVAEEERAAIEKVAGLEAKLHKN